MMGIKVTDWRVADVASSPEAFGIEGHIAGLGWVSVTGDDDGNKPLTFATREEADAEVGRLKAQKPAG